MQSLQYAKASTLIHHDQTEHLLQVAKHTSVLLSETYTAALMMTCIQYSWCIKPALVQKAHRWMWLKCGLQSL